MLCHNNSLGGYIGSWLVRINLLKKSERPCAIPRAVNSYNDNLYHLSLMLSHLDNNLTRLEQTTPTPENFDYFAYAQARAFIKVCYILLRILLDDICGTIKFYYEKNDPKVGIPNSFNDLLKKAEKNKLPEDITALLKPSIGWFREMKTRRDDLGHRYESLLISFRRKESDNIVLGHFSTIKNTTQEYGDIREYFGFVLCEHQKLIDNLLDHFDEKFQNWYGIVPPRDASLLSDVVDTPLRWAHKYGNYRHKDLQGIE